MLSTNKSRLLLWVIFLLCFAPAHFFNQMSPVIAAERPGDPAAAEQNVAQNSNKSVNNNGTKRTDRDAPIRRLMNDLGIQVKEDGPEHGYLDLHAPAQDRARVTARHLVHPPDAFHTAPKTKAGATSLDPNRLKNLGQVVAGGRRAAAGLYNFNQRVRPEGRFGYGYSIGNQEGDLLDRETRPRFARRSFGLDGLPPIRISSPAAPIGRSTFGYGGFGRSSSSLYQPGSPSSPFSEFGGPSSTNTIGLGATIHSFSGHHGHR